MSELNTPRWDLSSLFESIECEKYRKTLSDYQTGIKVLEEKLKSSSFESPLEKSFMIQSDLHTELHAQWLLDFMEDYNAHIALENTLSAFAYIIYSTDTTNVAYLNNLSKIEELALESEKLSLNLQKTLFEWKETLPEIYEKCPELEKYRFIFEEEIEAFSHKMSESEENLASALQRTGGNAWDRLHEQIISNLKDSESGKTFNELRNDAYSPDAKVRKSAWEKEISLLKQNEIAFAACLNNLKGETVTLNRRRAWKEAVDRSLASSRMKKETLDSLIAAIEESLPQWRRYLRKKAELIYKNKNSGNKNENGGLAFYDLFAPLPSENCDSVLSKTWTFEEAKNYVLDRYYSFSSDMGDFAKNAFEKNWIDAEVRKGKVGGAYDEDFALKHESRVLTNFTGSFSDIITLAHELGHAYHFSCLKGLNPIFFSYPMTLAETASTFAETIVKQDALEKASGSDKLLMLELDLQDACQVLVDILCRYYFEKAVFEKRKESELTAEDFCALMKEAQEKSYGDGLSDERHEYMWAVKSHYYSTGLDFYNFPYAFGQLFAVSLYQTYLKESKKGNDFSKTYASLLRDTGSMSCEDLCKKAGFDITKKEFWLEGINFYKKEIDLFCS